MKSIALIAAVLAAALCQAQIKMTLTVNGQNVGTGVLTEKLNASGGLESTIQMKIQAGGANADFSHVSVCDKQGRPLRETSVETSGPKSKKTTIVFGAKTVKITKIEDGKLTSSTVAIPNGNISDTSGFWFVSTRPKPGTSSTFLEFDGDTMKWKSQTAKFVGDEKVPGTTKTGHRVHHDNGDMWLDDKGMPLRMEINADGVIMVLVRQ